MKEELYMFEGIYGEIMNAYEVAEALGISTNAVYELLNDQSLKGFKVGKKIWKIPRESLEEYIRIQTGLHAK